MSDLPDKLPRHVAFIMDGNGRWARAQGLSRTRGHEAGAQTVRTVLECCRDWDIRYLTLYAFSTENWKRPAREVRFLMNRLKRFIKERTADMVKDGIRLNPIGNVDGLPEDVRESLRGAVDATAGNRKYVVNLAINYGSRDEIARAAREIARKAAAGEIDPESVDEQTLAAHLYTAGTPDPDMIIRTAGESRLSNFMLWQGSYAEIYVTDVLWPEFGREDFLAALRWYAGRKRRFGGLSASRASRKKPGKAHPAK